MKKILTILLIAALPLTGWAGDIMRKTADGTYIVNTTTLCKARGFKAQTPLEVHIKHDKVVNIVALRNKETPKYFAIAINAVSKTLKGKKVAKALSTADGPAIDGTTGATFSTKALQMNVKEALKYYKKHK